MNIRKLPDYLINQIAAGEVVERPASVVKELVENALDAGADQIVIDVIDGGRTLISIIDNGSGMSREDLSKCILRHATSKLPGDDLLNINFMGFRGEALPSIASVSEMMIETNHLALNCSTGEIRPCAWESGTRVQVNDLFAKTPARLKFLRSDRAEIMSVVENVKRLAMARPDVGFTLNNKWRFPKDQPLMERVVAIMGDDVAGRMIEVSEGQENEKIKGRASSSFCPSGSLSLTGYISHPTLRRASGIDQYLFVNGRPVKDKVLMGALRAAYIDVMHAREFPLCALYLKLPPREIDVNVSPAKTEVHFLEPARVRGFIVGTLRRALAETLGQSAEHKSQSMGVESLAAALGNFGPVIKTRAGSNYDWVNDTAVTGGDNAAVSEPLSPFLSPAYLPLGKVIGQIGNKYILAENENGLVVIDQHAGAERITYERLRKHEIKAQPLLFPVVVALKPEQVAAILEVAGEMRMCGVVIDQFGEDAVAVSEKPADWDLDWPRLLHEIADEVQATGTTAQLYEKLHLKLANYACHHSVRAGLKLSPESMDALLRDIENTERGGECNHGRPVYKFFPIAKLDGLFERS